MNLFDAARMPMVERLDQRAIEKMSGPSWEPLRPIFFDTSLVLLAVSPEAMSELTTIYVKFFISTARRDVYAVVWLKNSKQIVIGLSLPDEVESAHLCPPPQGMKYRGLTKYLTLRPGEEIPDELADWARLAHACTLGSLTG
jgi:hypothetical protein